MAIGLAFMRTVPTPSTSIKQIVPKCCAGSKSQTAAKAEHPRITQFLESWVYHLRNINSECCRVISHQVSPLKPHSLFYTVMLDKCVRQSFSTLTDEVLIILSNRWSRSGENQGYVGYLGVARKSVVKQLQAHRRAAKKIIRFYQELIAAYYTFSTLTLYFPVVGLSHYAFSVFSEAVHSKLGHRLRSSRLYWPAFWSTRVGQI